MADEIRDLVPVGLLEVEPDPDDLRRPYEGRTRETVRVGFHEHFLDPRRGLQHGATAAIVTEVPVEVVAEALAVTSSERCSLSQGLAATVSGYASQIFARRVLRRRSTAMLADGGRVAGDRGAGIGGSLQSFGDSRSTPAATVTHGCKTQRRGEAMC